MRVLVAGASDIGRIRERNEDSYVIGDLDAGELWDGDGPLEAAGPRGPFIVVCDGMGGAAAGEVASRLAVETIAAQAAGGAPSAGTQRGFQPRTAGLGRAIEEANRVII